MHPTYISKRNSLTLFFLCIVLLITLSCDNSDQVKISWPEITKETKPWTRWWWQGSAVTKAEITSELEAFQKAGLGGVEITPIYGVYGGEDEFIQYLSPQWVEMLEHTLKEADRLGLGVDMATGTGWPFGGPWVSDEDACRDMTYKVYELREGQSIKEPVSFHQEPFIRSVGMQIYEAHGIYKVEGQETKGTVQEPLLRNTQKKFTISDLVEPVAANKNLQALALDQVKFDKQLSPVAIMAYSESGEAVNLSNKMDKNQMLNWIAPKGKWKVYAVFPGWHGKMVERAAPGGEGNVIDHFSKEALQNYLLKFDEAFKGRDIKSLRAFFNDSYEVDDARGTANWTPDLFEEFKNRRGYDLREHLPALFGQDEQEKNERVLCDYRETISELIYDNFTSAWKSWANRQGKIVRNQAHGSPSNILDLYSEVDIPEIEGTEILRIKMASSASNVSGKKLTSSESATWLNEHFLSNLADIKESLDRFMVGGVNHTFYHGTCYSPKDEPWPGWLFYAAVHLNPWNPMWDDFSTLNQYVSRCQSFLQKGTPDNDILLYYPVYDRFSSPGPEMIEHFDGVDKQFEGTAFKESAEQMIAKGFTFDYVSDKQIKNLKMDSDEIRSSPISSYRTILIPSCKYIPSETFKSLMKLVNEGTTILLYKDFPSIVSGFSDYGQMKNEYTNALNRITFTTTKAEGVEEAHLGKGRFIRSNDLTKLMEEAGIKREQLVDKGLQFIRKKNDKGTFYFVSNWTGAKIVGWVPLLIEEDKAVLFDPMTGTIGEARTQSSDTGTSVYLQLEKGESMIIQGCGKNVKVNSFDYKDSKENDVHLNGKWKLSFVQGGPTLPAPKEIDSLISWTNFDNEELKKFSGTGSYEISFEKPDGEFSGWLLDLGTVHETARIFLNEDSLATLIGPTYQVYMDHSLLKDINKLRIEVSNLMANRIIDLEKRGVLWKKFYNVNFPARLAENRKNGIFDAAHWDYRESGLMGPVVLRPYNHKPFN